MSGEAPSWRDIPLDDSRLDPLVSDFWRTEDPSVDGDPQAAAQFLDAREQQDRRNGLHTRESALRSAAWIRYLRERHADAPDTSPDNGS